MQRLPLTVPRSSAVPVSGWPTRAQRTPQWTPPRRRHITASGADDDGAHLYGRAAGGGFGAVEQRSGTQLATGGRWGVEFVERRIYLSGKRSQLSAGGGANRGVARAERGVVRVGLRAVSGGADPGP